MTYYTIYKIINKITGKFYIGAHQTKNIYDEYMGSGVDLIRDQIKYGINSFEKEILFVFNNADDMYKKEKELVDKEFVISENTYNLKTGGHGGWDHENFNSEKQRQKAIKANKKIKELLQSPNSELLKLRKKIGSENLKNAHKQGKIKYNTFLGKKHTLETKKKIGEKNSEHQSGNKNSQFGTRWIYSDDLKSSKRIKNNDPLPLGWNEGRKMKF
jgi:hypothetical protein